MPFSLACPLCYLPPMNRRRTFNRGRWELDRERFQISDFEPPSPHADPKPIEALIPSILKGMKLDGHALVSRIAAVWEDIVGPQLAANTRPAHVENKCLAIHVSHPMWLFELRGAPSREIQSRIQTRFGPDNIKSIRFSIDPNPPSR